MASRKKNPSTNSRRDPELTRQEILEAATDVFSRLGPLGASIDAIVAQTKTSKRMIYYYFGSKQALYETVLKTAYQEIRKRELDLGLSTLEPTVALRLLTRETLQHFENHVKSARVIAYENLQYHGKTLQDDPEFKKINASALNALEDILSRGKASGVFRDGPDAPSAVDVHQVLSSMALYRIEHQPSFHLLFDRDMLSEEESPHIRRIIEETVLGLVLSECADASAVNG